jgi:transposase
MFDWPENCSRLKSGSMLLADRGYDTDWIRKLAMKKGAWANIPPKSNRSDPICFSPFLCRARNRVERFFNRIKQCRRVATRYERLQGLGQAQSLHRCSFGGLARAFRSTFHGDPDCDGSHRR